MLRFKLHLAAYLGRKNIVEELISKGAEVDNALDQGHDTPLTMAATKGQVSVMIKLMNHGANPNAVSTDSGPVINKALYSGSREAVQALVERGVSLSLSSDDYPPALALAAAICDISMYEYLTKELADKFQPEDYSNAVVTAGRAGRIEILGKLLDNYEHPKEYCQSSLDWAAAESNWDCILLILEKVKDLDCSAVFHEAATCTEQQDKVLEAIWEYSNGTISPETLDKSLYEATDKEKESTVRLLLEKFNANPNATGEE
jgi:ankyrin repeat protein